MDREWLRRQAIEFGDRAEMHISVNEGPRKIDTETFEKAKAFLMLLHQERPSDQVLGTLVLSDWVTWDELLEFARGAYFAI